MHFLSLPQSERRLVRRGYDLKGLEMREANRQGKKGHEMFLHPSSPAFMEQKGKKLPKSTLLFFFPLISEVNGRIKVILKVTLL